MVMSKNYCLFSLIMVLTLVPFQHAGADERPTVQLNITREGQTVKGSPATPSLEVKQVGVVAGEQNAGPQASGDILQKTTDGQPQIVIESPTHDAGEVWEGEDITHSFIIKNAGTAELNIKNVKAG